MALLRASRYDIGAAAAARRGKLARFSMERLERFLIALDMEIRIQVRPRPSGKKRPGISVEVVGAA